VSSQMWDERYAAKELVWSADPNQFLPPAVADLPVGRSLDLACGEGRNAIWLASQGWDSTAVDFSAVGLEKGQAIAEREGLTVNWVLSNVLNYQSAEQFDLIVVFYVHLPSDQLDAMFTTSRGLLAPGGKIVGVGHALRNLEDGVGGPQHPSILWEASSAQEWLSGCEAVVVEERLRQTDAGTAIDLYLEANAPR
jgi:SAM-dependent methyltransferase